MKTFTTILVLAVLVGGGYWYWSGQERSPDGEAVCTREAKICPDGSGVVRMPPSCEFAVCPQAKVKQDKDVSLEKVNEWGAKLNSWAYYPNPKLVSVNGIKLNRSGPNTGGYSPVFWNVDLAAGFKFVVLQSSCEIEMLNIYFTQLDWHVTTPEQLAGDLSCLGKWEFRKTELGVM